MEPTASSTGENLAIIFQELITVTVRLRGKTQPLSDASSFRQQIRAALTSAQQEAARRGYSGEDIRLAIFAVVAFLDESVLNSGNPIFADWPRKPLQEEIFGVHVAGEIFFRNIDVLLARQDSPQLDEVLEIYQLCLLLGFRGRYSAGANVASSTLQSQIQSNPTFDLRNITEAIAAKRKRIRTVSPVLSPNPAPAADAPVVIADPWLRRLSWGAIGASGVAVILFLLYFVLLRSSVSDLASVLTQHKL